MEGVTLSGLAVIHHPKGNLFHGIKCTDPTFAGFGEAYFTSINRDVTKGWKKHLRMTMNIVVPVGLIRFYIYNENTQDAKSVLLGEDHYSRLTVRNGLWVAFTGVSDGLNLALNIASIPHDPNEAISVPLETFPIPAK